MNKRLKIYKNLEKKELLSNNQFGFTQDTVLNVTEHVTKLLSKNTWRVSRPYKAFETVSIPIFLAKLESRIKSVEADVNNFGVGQRSILGSTLFLMFIKRSL